MPLSKHDTTQWDWKGAPGFKASDLNDLVVGKTYLLPLFNPWWRRPGTVTRPRTRPRARPHPGKGGVGQNAYYQIVQFVGIQITQVDKSSDCYVRPCYTLDPAAVLNSSSVTPVVPGNSSQTGDDVHHAEVEPVTLAAGEREGRASELAADEYNPPSSPGPRFAMHLTCPDCGAVIPAEDVNIDSGLGKCRAVQHRHRRSEGRARPGRRAGVPPAAAGAAAARITIEDLGGGLRLTRRWFTLAVLFLTFFCVGWDSFSSSGIRWR